MIDTIDRSVDQRRLARKLRRFGHHPLRIFSGTASRPSAKEVASRLGVSLGRSTTTRLPDSEVHVQIDDLVRDHDIFLIQPCSAPVNDTLMELLLYIDAFRKASVHSITAKEFHTLLHNQTHRQGDRTGPGDHLWNCQNAPGADQRAERGQKGHYLYHHIARASALSAGTLRDQLCTVID